MSKQMVFVAAAIVISALVGFAAGRSNKVGTSTVSVPQGADKPSVQVQTTKSLEAPINPIFKTQSATFQGKITKVSDNALSVESEKGEKGEFGVSDKVVIYKFAPGSSTATSSSDLKLLETDKMVLIALELINNKYQATSISYFRTQ